MPAASSAASASSAICASSTTLIPVQSGACAVAAGTPASSAGSATGNQTGLYAARALHVQGSSLYDPTGKKVALRGVDVGGWLMPEGWMCGMDGSPFGADPVFRWTIEDLEKRFTEQQAMTLMNAWYDNWFTTADLDQIQKLGFNALRVPFSWRNFQNEQGQWVLDASGNVDFSRLDWIVTQAAARNIYVVLDFHMWQGQQANYATINTSGSAGDTQRNEGTAIWLKVAAHFQGNGAIAGFDVINEPDLSGGSPGDLPQNAFFKAIRSVDPTRIAIIESNSFSDMSGFSNSMWSDHYPNGGWNNGSGWDSSNFNGPGETGSGVAPVFIGEFHAQNDVAATVGQSLDQSGVSWTSWTYKGMGVGDWALYNYGQPAMVNILTASYAQILSTWTNNLGQSALTPQTGLVSGYSAAAQAP